MNRGETYRIIWACNAGETYIEYALDIEASVVAGERATFDYPGVAPEVDGFRVAGVESAVAYPFGGKFGYALSLTHEEPQAYAVLLAQIDAATHDDDEAVHELILSAWEREGGTAKDRRAIASADER
jgi:hypothetical protein